jgi:hypothetical protein
MCYIRKKSKDIKLKGVCYRLLDINAEAAEAKTYSWMDIEIKRSRYTTQGPVVVSCTTVM